MTASPDWRDPAMPVQRHYVMADGRILSAVDPEYERRFREHLMATTSALNWRNDPTYNLRKKPAR